jgi:hypothetical protein
MIWYGEREMKRYGPTTGVGEDVEEKEPSYTVGGNAS